MKPWRSVNMAVLAMAVIVLAGSCRNTSPLPTPVQPTSIAGPLETAAGATTGELAAEFTPFWVQNHRTTEMWSGPSGTEGVIGFGTTSDLLCSFLVVRPQDNARLHVFNPFSENYFWIDAEAVGPVGVPERRPEPMPADQNCAAVIYVSG